MVYRDRIIAIVACIDKTFQPPNRHDLFIFIGQKSSRICVLNKDKENRIDSLFFFKYISYLRLAIICFYWFPFNKYQFFLLHSAVLFHMMNYLEHLAVVQIG